MNALKLAMLAALMCASTAAFAQDAMTHDSMKNDTTMMADMKAMDANGDGMISKDEYMKSDGATAMKWAAMKKNKGGMVSLKDMQMKHDKMMKKDGGGH